jgi:hypothetical protein
MSIRDVQGSGGEKTQRTLPKKGPRVAVLVALIDVGVQVREWKGELKKPCREIIPIFELTKDCYETEDGKENNIRLSLFPIKILPGADKSKYVKLINALDPEHKVLDDKGRGDVTKLIGTGCFVNVVHTEPNEDGLIYANIKEVTELPEDFPSGDVKGETYFFDATEPDPEIAQGFTDHVRNHFRTSVDYVGSELEKVIETGSATSQEGKPELDEGEDSPI